MIVLVEEAEVDGGEEGLGELGPGFDFLVGREAGEEGLGGGEFAFGGRAGKDELVEVLNVGFFLEDFLSCELRLLPDEGAVHEEKRLGGEVGGGTSADDEVGVWSVENFEDREHGVAKPRHVDAATIGVKLVVEIVLSGFADGEATPGRVELSADAKHGVANCFGLESFAVGVAKEAVFGIFFVSGL